MSIEYKEKIQMNTKVTNFTDLNAWKLGHEVVLSIYKETKIFPDDERFGLTSQLRRASVSITSNLAEGFSRFTSKDKIRFYTIALGSLTEVQNQLLIAKDLGYIRALVYENLKPQLIEIHKMLYGLVKSADDRA